jgi:glucose-6-phosphate 1-epimerase
MTMIEDLKRRVDLPRGARIEPGQGELPRLVVETDLASAELYLHGAHLTRWQPRDEKPVLFMSQKSHFAAGKPIRGGVPLIFPWFGPRAQSPESPAHGFARTHEWTLKRVDARKDGSVEVGFTLGPDPVTQGLWPHPFGLEMGFRIGASLDMLLEVRGPGAGAAPISFEEALHTYFLVGDVRQVSVEGLENTGYLDKVESFRRKVQPAEPIRITGETDRVFLDTRSTCVLRDPVFERTITVEKEGSITTVVWNPWIDKARAMPDFGDEEWPRMICIETANVGDGAIRLEGSATHRMRAHIRLSR